jgi:hypothetical protein
MSDTPLGAEAQRRPSVKRLDSGYWYVRWSAEIWAQWPVGRFVHRDDFFHPDYAATPERLRLCDEVTHV